MDGDKLMLSESDRQLLSDLSDIGNDDSDNNSDYSVSNLFDDDPRCTPEEETQGRPLLVNHNRHVGLDDYDMLRQPGLSTRTMLRLPMPAIDVCRKVFSDSSLHSDDEDDDMPM